MEDLKMKKWFAIVAVILISSYILPALAGSGHEGMGDMSKTGESSTHAAESFKHKAVVDGVRTEFEIMSLAAMKMKDETGATHHVMLKLYGDATGDQIHEAIGKVKVIDPSGAEQISDLKNYNGIFAANLTFKDPGKYGIICLFKVNGKKEVIKFWYPHNV